MRAYKCTQKVGKCAMNMLICTYTSWDVCNLHEGTDNRQPEIASAVMRGQAVRNWLYHQVMRDDDKEEELSPLALCLSLFLYLK